MSIEINMTEAMNYVVRYVSVIPRLSGLAVSMPVISSAVNPRKVKVSFVILLSFFVLNNLSDDFILINIDHIDFLSVVNEFLLGILMGTIIQFVFQAFVVGGQVISLQAGLSFATLVDPATKASVPLLSQFYLMLMSLIFISLNGHLYLINLIIESFHYIHVGTASITSSFFWKIITFSSVIFKGSIVLSLPAIISLLVVSISFGIMMKAAPQINIFSVGFPITLTLGVVIITITLNDIYPQIDHLLTDAMALSRSILTHG